MEVGATSAAGLGSSGARPRVAVVGVCVIDVLGRPVDELPRGQVAKLLEEIKLTPAGTAAGTSVDLARLGAEVVTVGAAGEDLLGDVLVEALAREGVESRIVRKAGVQTSATILPIHPDGSRPAWHVPGANRELGPEDVPRELLASCDAFHFGGITALPRLDGEPAAELLRQAREHGAVTTADFLGIKRADALQLLEACLPHVDVFMPNRAEALAVTELGDVTVAARRLRELGAKAVIVTCDSDGCLIADADGERSVPAMPGPVVDSTGCGDAFCAGVIAGLCRGWKLDRAARLGIAAATLTLGGLGSDAGVRSFDETVAYMERYPQESVDLEVA